MQRSQKFVQYLPLEGFLPIVVTGPTSVEDRWTPGDRTLIGTIRSDTPIYRAEGPIPKPGRFLGRLKGWLALPGKFSKWWIRSATEAACRVTDSVDLIFVTMSPFEGAEVARRLSQRLGVPWIADLRDPWALDEMQVYPTLIHRKIELARMQKLLSTAALIIMNTPDAAAALTNAFPRLRGKKILTITNGFDQEDFADAVPPRSDSKFRIVHSGYLHTANGLRLRSRGFYRVFRGAEPGVDILTRSHAVLLEAVERWCSQRPEVTEDVEIVFAGETSREDRALAERSGAASMTRFTGYLSHHDSLELVRNADLLFLPMHNLPAGKRSSIVPGKSYEYMASGRPILAAVPDGDAKDFLSHSGNALICRPDDILGMIRILDRVYTAWKQGESIVSPNESFVTQFERRKLTRALAKGFASVIRRATGVVAEHSKAKSHIESAV